MRLAVSGTYSSGKTTTVMALSHYTGVPRTLARTIREILPEAVPGKRLGEVSPAEYLQLAMLRHCGRAVHEASLGDTFVSDGSSLQEWIYAALRIRFGMNPSANDVAVVERANLSEEMLFFEQVVEQFGNAFKRHVASTFDGFVHLNNELPLAADGHRPMHEDFRAECDRALLTTLDELDIPYEIVSGTLEERLVTIRERWDLPEAMSITDAVALAREAYATVDWRLETERAHRIGA